MIVFEMLKEFNDKKNDFGLTEANTFIGNLADDYMKRIDNSFINKAVISIKDSTSSDIDNIIKLSIGFTPKYLVFDILIYSSNNVFFKL